MCRAERISEGRGAGGKGHGGSGCPGDTLSPLDGIRDGTQRLRKRTLELDSTT